MCWVSLQTAAMCAGYASRCAFRRESRCCCPSETRGRASHHPYAAKWYGAHGLLVALAELCYPPGDESLVPLRDQIMGWLFSGDYERRTGRVHGLPTLHASIDGNAVWSALLSASLTNALSRWSSGYLTRSGRTAGGTATGGRAAAPHPSPRVSSRSVPWPCTPGRPEMNSVTSPRNAPASSSSPTGYSGAATAEG